MKAKKIIYRAILASILVFSTLIAIIFNNIGLPIKNQPIYLYTLCLASVFTFLLFLVICSIKKMISFMPYLLIAIGLCGYLTVYTAFSYSIISYNLAYSLGGGLIGIGVIGAALTISLKIGRLPVKIPLIAYASVCTLLDLVYSFLGVSSNFLKAFIAINCIICIALIITAVFICAKDAHIAELLTPTMLCCVLALFSVIHPTEYVNIRPSEYILSLLLILCILIYGIKEVIIIERRNIYLTENMQLEISRQTEEMQKIIKERESMMRFISHDMRKPVVTMRKFISVARDREQDIEQIKTIDIIDQKAVQIEKNLDEISKYAKHTYYAEQSKTLSVKKIMQEVYNDLNPDCAANGIIFDVNYINAHVYAKPTILKSVLTNIIMNAIEHASCTSISMNAQKSSDTVAIIISDNGKGMDVDADKHIFKPYADQADEDRTHGLGLYICKTHIENMNGSIEYSSSDKGLTFTIRLPKA